MSDYYQVQEREGKFHVVDTRPDDSRPEDTSISSYDSREEAEAKAKQLNERSLG